ncbi:MAG: four-carbon acid sugar kinase family protein [Spirochaetaceae bacterium]|nr:MAG: four-carbon acid sugar kinase family protein [Spirochaetaceae bacterium]
MSGDAQPKIVVLDDDPTGSQTVHGCLLLMRWDESTLRTALADDSPLFFVLTNTRSMSAVDAAAVTRQVCANLKRALVDFDQPWLVVSRSDSTLRGHYPVETDVIAEELGPFDAHFLTPQFFEGGRITKDATHYVVRDGVATPAHQTEFARDSVFGYTTSYLPDYVEEKTGGKIGASSVTRFAPDQTDDDVRSTLDALAGNACCVVSAQTQAELDRFARHVLDATAGGKRFLFRSAASLLTSLAALPPQPVAAMQMARYVPEGRPGLVLVGSHVPMSTRQLDRLVRERSGTGRLESIELDVARLPDPSGAVVDELADLLRDAHLRGCDAVVSTSRTERTFASAAQRLAFGEEVSRVLMSVVRSAPESLGFVLSKGGITSNDVLSKGLGLTSARVVGQIHPGCSVVLTPSDHRHGSIPVVIFPGNVGTEESVRVVYDRLTGV